MFKAAARRDVRDIIGRLMNISGVVTTARRPVAISGRLGAPGAIDQGRRFSDTALSSLCLRRQRRDQADPADAHVA
ncbi:hypothetical protein ATN81_06455 [Agrobacterium pusense]|jgi:hypothetical protein|uniref:Uncharacterized protein n=1 Tax=Agrobacterium genomosp. 2 str. CFBP 5494 TaxID=1183436 RepID=A0A9W5B6A2_9HYPH|nr:hypothetical protein ATN81_06455 [Agrobacterium pusense]OJH55835.1 hypothetical protein BA725_00385 [Agrobacterium pusense]RAL95331.1 hypothetical protein DOU54_25695 [Agrobacterium sp. MS2]CUX00714.1 hypothetical protein AGR2A_Lc90092 [Agrobacterium genomosp. 2 str. CFBP 5494]HCJ71760.1 hypothetical protein [Agrobacterium sp.]